MNATLYWDNKALPTSTLTLPHTLFYMFWLFPSFLWKINAFPMRYEIWKGRKQISSKGGFEPWSIASKSMCLTIYTTDTDVEQAYFLIVSHPNHTLVGGVGVNSQSYCLSIKWLLSFCKWMHRNECELCLDCEIRLFQGKQRGICNGCTVSRLFSQNKPWLGDRDLVQNSLPGYLPDK